MAPFQLIRAVLAAARFSKRYFVAAVSLFAVELVIALFIDDEFVRPLLGDTLAVVLLYVALMSAWRLPLAPTVLGLLVLFCSVEVAQAFRVVELLGLQHFAAARVIIGTSYDPRDFVAYAAGACMIAIGERGWGAQRPA